MKYNFSNKFITTKEELNKFISDEDIIFHYFGDFEPNKYYISPRGEGDPSLIFDYWEGELKWRDFGRSIYPRNAVEFVIYINELKDKRITIREAISTIQREVKTGTCPEHFSRKAKEKNVGLRFRKKWHPWELDYWKEYGLELERLTKFNVYPCEVWFNQILWHRSKMGDPCYVYLWDAFDSVWQAYRPLAPIEIIKGVKKRSRFFGNNISDHIQGWDELPESGPLCVITEGYKDVMVWDCLNVPSVAPHGASRFLSEEQITELKCRFKYIYVNYDNDLTGVTNSINYVEKYKLNYWNVPLQYSKCTDPSDLVKRYGLSELAKCFQMKLEINNMNINNLHGS